MKEHPLARYLRVNGISYGAFSRMLGRDRTTVSRIAKGERRVSRVLARQIETATEGKLTADKLLGSA